MALAATRCSTRAAICDGDSAAPAFPNATEKELFVTLTNKKCGTKNFGSSTEIILSSRARNLIEVLIKAVSRCSCLMSLNISRDACVIQLISLLELINFVWAIWYWRSASCPSTYRFLVMGNKNCFLYFERFVASPYDVNYILKWRGSGCLL